MRDKDVHRESPGRNTGMCPGSVEHGGRYVNASSVGLGSVFRRNNVLRDELVFSRWLKAKKWRLQWGGLACARTQKRKRTPCIHEARSSSGAIEIQRLRRAGNGTGCRRGPGVKGLGYHIEETLLLFMHCCYYNCWYCFGCSTINHGESMKNFNYRESKHLCGKRMHHIFKFFPTWASSTQWEFKICC